MCRYWIWQKRLSSCGNDQVRVLISIHLSCFYMLFEQLSAGTFLSSCFLRIDSFTLVETTTELHFFTFDCLHRLLSSVSSLYILQYDLCRDRVVDTNPDLTSVTARCQKRFAIYMKKEQLVKDVAKTFLENLYSLLSQIVSVHQYQL